jgi:SAM-dependent methyltransferase
MVSAHPLLVRIIRMTTPDARNPTDRFSGLAALYAQCRPAYPDAAVDYVVTRCGLSAAALVVDVGCGTGISSRQLARHGLHVLGIEPNDDMRAQAISEALPADVPVPDYRAGRAEATGLPASCADVVLAAQAFHWFDPDAALREFYRILKPSGWTVLMWNERDESDPFTAAYGAVIRTAPDAAAVEVPRGRAGEALFHCPSFRQVQRVEFANEQAVDEDGLLGRAFSASYAPRDPDQARVFAAALRAVFARFQQHGRVVIRYVTTVYSGQRE